MNFRQLQVFQAVARNKSFTGAAKELFLTQPAVSIQIQQLEEAYQAKLEIPIRRRPEASG
jgi:DNA-binding transcriptional LysR family regulator